MDAFRRVEKLTGYRIMYSYDDVKNYKAQSMPSSKNIHKALSQVLGNLPLDFTINGKFVSISKKISQVSNISLSSDVKEERLSCCKEWLSMRMANLCQV